MRVVSLETISITKGILQSVRSFEAVILNLFWTFACSGELIVCSHRGPTQIAEVPRLASLRAYASWD